ncbi:hypothetical protein CsSME_00045079 [Camellia sinensis var. sinensis]
MEEEPEYIPMQRDLLLREPESHLSHDVPEDGQKWGIYRYGSTGAREWYIDLPDGVRQIIDEAGFGLFCMGLSCLMASRTLLGALVERWWDTTNSFHFSATGDMTMTPYDFAMLTGLEVGGRSIPYDPLWIYAYFPMLAPEPEVETPPEVPYSHRYDGRCQPKAWETLPYHHMAALGIDARVCSISFCRGLGCLPVSDSVRGTCSAHALMRRAVDIPSSNSARAANAPLTRRTRAPRSGARGMPSTRHSWRYSRVPYQIPLEPPLPDHRYVRTPDSPPPSIEYVEGLLELMASFEGMILRRETMLSSHGIQDETSEDE